MNLLSHATNISENGRRRKRPWQKLIGRGHGTKWRKEGMTKNGGNRAFRKRLGRWHGENGEKRAWRKWRLEGMAKNTGRGHDKKGGKRA